ncbi:MAG: putative zinc-binding metallopeptidase [Myxococcota bacterium]
MPLREAEELIGWLRQSRHVPTLAAHRAWDEPAHLSPARHPALTQVMRELRAVGIRERFTFLWAHDGSGVETWEPDVIHIDRSLRRTTRAPSAVRALADGVMGLTIADVARHEIGHALQFARPWVTRGARFRRLFGDTRKAYRVGNPVDEIARRLRQNDALRNPRYRRMVSVYAATHPYEKFAETFRVALEHRCDAGRLRDWCARNRKHALVTEQLAFVCAWIARLASDPNRR